MSSSTKEQDDAIKAAAQKFLFDRHDFSEDAIANAQEEEARHKFTQDDIDAARTDSFELGKAEGLSTAKQQQQEAISQTLNSISDDLKKLIQAESDRNTMKNADVATLTISVSKKLLPGLAKKYALGEVEATLINALNERHEEPRLAIRVPDNLLEPLQQKIDKLVKDQGFAGQVILLADDAMSQTDCKVEWADGGAERDFEALFSTIEGHFISAIEGLNNPTTPPTNEPEIKIEPKIEPKIDVEAQIEAETTPEKDDNLDTDNVNTKDDPTQGDI